MAGESLYCSDDITIQVRSKPEGERVMMPMAIHMGNPQCRFPIQSESTGSALPARCRLRNPIIPPVSAISHFERQKLVNITPDYRA